MIVDEHEARTILAHLNDFSFLGRHPLARTANPADGATARGCRAREAGQAVNAWLIMVLDDMARECSPHAGSIESRYHTVLRATYVERASTTLIAAQWNASERSVERWRRDALRIYADLLNERIDRDDPA